MHCVSDPLIVTLSSQATRTFVKPAWIASKPKNRLRQLTAHPHDHGFGLRADNAGVMAQQKLVDKLAADLKRLQELQQARTAAWQAASAALANVEAWLRDGKPHGTTLEPVETEVTLNKGEGILDAISRLQRRGRELKAAIHTVRSASFPSSYAKRRMREMVATFGARQAIGVASCRT